MKLDLEVLASTTIQRHKPWPRILWIGEEQESLLLLDPPGHRTSVLYVPSGKTKRKLPKLATIVEQALCYSRTKNGRYLLGLLQSGELFVWHKDKDVIKIIPGLSKLTKNYQAVPCYITASDDCAHIFLSVGTSLFFLWEMEKGESISKDRDAELKGNWHKVMTPSGMELPNTESRESSLAGIFYTSPVLGTCCQFSIIYNSTDMLRIITLLLKFPDPADSFGKSLPIFSAEWSLLEYPFEQMHPNFEAVCTVGAYVSGYCGNGQVLAVAANQRLPSQTAMLFVSPLTDTVLVAGMKSCGIGDPNKAGRHYWVVDLAWTSDSLFLACILRNGSVCVMSRLGEPMIIQTEGCSVSMGPSHYLPLHPAIFVSDNHGSLEPSAAEQDPMRQHFSLATHPSLPIILFSDGFLVTVIQLPVDVNSATMMRDLVLESARYLKKVYEQENLDMTVADAYKLAKGQRNSKPAQDRERLKKVFEFELAEISLNSTHDSEVSMIDTTNKFGFDQFGAIGNMDAGKIVFGEPEMISIDPNATFSGLDASESLLKYLEESMTALVLSWKLAATYSDMWTADVDNIAKQTVHNLSKIFSIVLDCPAVDAIIPVLTPRQSSAIQNPRVYNIIVTYRNILQLLRFDKFNQHLIPAALRLVHKTITLMLASKELENTDPRLKTLFGCYSLLRHAEASLNKIYDLSSVQSQNSSPSSSGQNKFVSTLMEKFGKQSTAEGSGTSQQVHQMPLPGRRLAMTWKLLFKHLAQYQSQLFNSGDPNGELQHLEKLMSTIQQTLQESYSDITPRKASAKLSIAWLKHTFPFDLLSESDSFLFNDSNPETPSSTNLGTPSTTTLRSPSSKGTGSSLKSPSTDRGSSLGSPCSVTLGTPSSGGFKSSTDSRTSTWRSSPILSSPKFKAMKMNGIGKGDENLNGPEEKLGDCIKVQVVQTDAALGNRNKIKDKNKGEMMNGINTESTGQNKAEIQKGPMVNSSVNLEETRSFSVHSLPDGDRKTLQVNGHRREGMKSKIDKLFSDKLSVDGEHTLAVEAWKDQLKALAGAKDSPKTAKMLHAILYTHLMKGELGQAVDFVDGLIMQASVAMATGGEELPVYDDGSRPALMTLVSHRSQDSNEEEFVPCIKNKSIRQTVQTMARFMAAYFSNEPMFIFPPHSAQALPSVHMSSQPTKSRIIPKYHEDITIIITRENLSAVWTTERTVEYLLLSGLICETAWFASKMGDWKTAYMLSVAHVSHRDIAPFLYKKPKKPLQLPESLAPGSVIQEKLQIMIQSNTADSAPVGKGKRHRRYFIPINQETNIPQLTRTLQDVFMAGIICHVELAPWFLSRLVEKLKSVVAGLPSLVPDDFYLPSPPLYCPQPGEIEMSTERPDVEYEKELRLEISSLIQLILVAFNSAHLSLPVARWYVQELFKVQERAAQFKATTEGPSLELPEVLTQYKILRSSIVDFKDDPHVHDVLCSFRDFCTILWLLHVRDELSIQLRKRGNQLHNERANGKDSAESTLAQSWVQECFKTIKWAVQLLSFSQYITDDGCIHKVLLSLILELRPTEDIADILAEHFYMAENLDPEVQEKLERVLSNWTSIEIHPEDDGKSARLDDVQNGTEKTEEDEGDDVRKSVTFYDASPRSKTLSVYYHKQCDVVQKVLKKKRKCFGQYEEFVFSSQQTDENSIRNGGSIFIGSRPFETKQSYLEFLDRFYAISFTKLVEKESEQSRNPVYPSLMPFSKLIRDAEFETFAMKNEETYQKKPASIVLASPRAKFIRSQSESYVQDAAEPDTVVSTNQKNRGLFRSSRSGDVQPPRGSNLLKYRSEGSLMVKNSPRNRSQRAGTGTGMSPTRAAPNMTGMASRFFQSEDVLYREMGESQEAHWILDVNFGESYLFLQKLLDWLHHWCCKQHSLGLHGKNEKDTALKPTMRIEVPTQLVVLSLWLLEHKYSRSKKKKATENQAEIIEKNVNVAEENLNLADDRPKLLKQKVLATVEEVTEHDSFTQVSNIGQRSRSHSPYHNRNRSSGSLRSRSHSPAADSREATLDYYRSITSTMEETEQIHSAYKKVLNDDESSSLEVSSLDPDDYEDDMKHTLSMIGSEHQSRSRTPKKRKSGRRQAENSPTTRNSSTLNNTLHFEVSPERANTTQNAPQTSTPLRNSRRHNQDEIQADLSHISVPPSGQLGLYTAPPPRGDNNNAPPSGGLGGHNTAPPEHYRGGLLGGDPGHTVLGVENQAGQDLGQQLQHIIRGELRRMLEVQHQSMMAMMGALDGQVPQVPIAWQPTQSTNQRPVQPSSRSLSPPRRGQQEEDRQRSPKVKKQYRGILGELHNLQISEGKEDSRRKSRSPGGTLRDGKENIGRSALHLSDLRDPSHQQEDIQLFRVEHGDPSNINFAPRFLRMPAERDTDAPLRFPHIPSQAWGQRHEIREKENIPDMPLLHVDRTVPGHVFPGSQRSRSLPRYIPQQGYFTPPQGHFQPSQGQAFLPAPVAPRSATEGIESPDSGIGIPLLRIPTEDERARRQPRFGELLPPDVVIETELERQKKEFLRERYAREFHELHAKQSEERDKQRFGENLLHLDFKTEEEEKIERQVKQMMKKQKSPRKGHEPVSEEISSRREVSKRSSARPKTPDSVRSKSKSVSVSRKSKSKSVHDQEGGEKAESGEEAESEAESEDGTEAESMEEDEEAELNDGYAFREGEFEAYLALEKQLAQTKDTNARIQLMTALKLQQRRMVENWKRPSRRPKVDFATMTQEHVDAEMATDIAMETESVRTAEKFTSITKDTGVDPIQEAVIEYNKSRQPAVLPPDIYMGLRFADASQQPSSDITGQQEPSRGRAYLNVVDVDASAILRDLHEKPEKDIESRLDASIPATQTHLRDRIAQEPGMRESLEPVIQRPTRADELTVKMFETRAMGEDRLSVAIMPRDSMPESKAAIMSRLRDMNQQLAAIDKMSNNMEREFKNTRLAIGTLEQMTAAMEPPARDRQEAVLEEEDMGPSPSGSRSLTPQHSAKSPTLSARATARSAMSARTDRSKKSTVEDKQVLSTELAKMSGLSGISDIIGDMVAKGEIDLEDAGLTQREADHLVKRGAIRHEEIEEARISLDEIKKMAKTASKAPDFSRDNLQEWMTARRHKQMAEYKKHLDELREKEPNPFKHKPGELDHSVTTRELHESETARQDHRKYKNREFMSKRLAEAQHLLGNILTDKPELPKEPPKSPQKHKLQRKDTSPAAKERKGKPYAKEYSPSAKQVQGILKTRDISPQPQFTDYSEYPEYEEYSEYPEYYEEEMLYREQIQPPRETEPAPGRVYKVSVAPAPEVQRKGPPVKPHPGVPRLKLSLEDVDEEPRLQQTVETTGDLSEYARAMEAMDESQEHPKDVARQPQQQQETPAAPGKPYKMKPYTEIVKVQRPEITRKKPSKIGSATYVGRLQTVSQSEVGTARTETTQREREMIYGSKRLPGKKPTETGPRRVKTYAERLQEMKSDQKFSTPVAPRSQYGSSIAASSARDMRSVTRVVKPKHKPMTYVEQLQKLNEGTHKPRMGQTTVVPRTMVKSHKPAHRPKTYAQQLQELQPAKTFTGPPSKRTYKPPAGHTVSRQRPYKDPYAPVTQADYDQWDRDSVVSAWSMDDNVRHLLYDDVASSIAVGQSASYAPSEQISDYYDVVMADVADDAYPTSFDFEELVRIADSGSDIISQIDWDEVENLIADES